MTFGATRLTTIASIDVAGFSAQTERDPDAAVNSVEDVRRRIELQVAATGARIFNTAGDGFMLEFPSVRSAADFCAALVGGHPHAGPKIRIGVHIGDVRENDKGDLLGHGVNAAARLQALAVPGTAVFSGDAARQLKGWNKGHLIPCGVMRLAKMKEKIAVFELSPISTGTSRMARRNLLRFATFGAGAAALAGGGAYFATLNAPKPRLAVLSFDITGPDDSAQTLAPLASSLADQIASLLSRNPDIAVVSRASVSAFAGLQLMETDASLVSHYLDGGIEAAGPVLKVSARLKRARTGATLWSETLTTSENEIFRTSWQIADLAGRRLTAASPAVQSQEPIAQIDPEALKLVFEGRTAWRRRTWDDLVQAVRCFQRAAALAPTYAPAWSGCAASWWSLSALGASLDAKLRYVTEAELAADRAYALDPASGEAVAVRGMCALSRGSWADCDRLLAAALKLEPSNATTRHWRGSFFMRAGRIRKAEQSMITALDLDPLAQKIAQDHALTLIYLKQFAKADSMIKGAQSIIETPSNQTWRLIEAIGRAEQGEFASAVELNPESLFLRVGASSGAERDKALKELEGTAVRTGEYGDFIAGLAIANREKDAVRQLQSLLLVRDGRYLLQGFPVERLFAPSLEPLRALPETNELFAQIGLAQYWRERRARPDFCGSCKVLERN